MIRRIEERDIPVILNWYNWYIQNSTATFETEILTLEAFQQRVYEVTLEYPWIVLEEDGRLCGYAYLSSFNPKQAYRCTADLTIYLDPEQRSKGYGSMLMKEMILLAKEYGYKNLVSLVTAGNTASEHLHEKNGFIRKATFEGIGCKHQQWLGVSYYYLSFRDDCKEGCE